MKVTHLLLSDKFIVGVIGPKTFFLGGHDFENELRTKLRSRFAEELIKISSQNINTVGLTGLNLGAEQDFGQSCIDTNIPFVFIKNLKNPEEFWPNNEYLIEKFRYLQNKSIFTIDCEYHKYNPKKNIEKNKKIIQMSNFIFLVKNKKFSNYHDYLMHDKILDQDYKEFYV